MKMMRQFLGLLLILIGFSAYGQTELDAYLVTSAKNNPGLKAKFNE